MQQRHPKVYKRLIMHKFSKFGKDFAYAHWQREQKSNHSNEETLVDEVVKMNIEINELTKKNTILVINDS